MQLIKISNSDYSQYEELLLRRDELEKEADHILIEYTRVFGDISTEIFKLKIDCIALKKSISYCVMAKNRGESVSGEKLREYIAEKIAIYTARLEEMIHQNELSKKGEMLSAFQAREIKRIYRKIAKILHPDISDITKKHPSLADLFQRVLVAYHCNDYKEMKELEVLVNRALDEIGEEKFELVIPDVEAKIAALEEEIQSITTTEPYILREILDDPERVRQKMSEFGEERDSYASYKAELESKLKEVQEG